MTLLLPALLCAACGRSEGAREPAPAAERGHAPTPFERILSGRDEDLLVERPTHLLPRLDEAAARRMFPLGSPGYEYDPITYFRRKAWARQKTMWPEHADGVFYLRTNAFGIREPEDQPAEHVDWRLFVTGDSHTDGVCNDDETYANQLERLLREREPERSIEVLNLGNGNYTFANYLGVLIKWLPLEPDVFVVGVYGGNDFAEISGVRHGFDGTRRPKGDKEYWQRLGSAQAAMEERGKAAVAQDFNQLVYFDHFPEEGAKSVDLAVEYTLEMARICRERSIRLIVLYIPPAADVDYERFGALFDLVAHRLDLDQEALGLTNRLADRFLERIGEAGVETLDGRPVLRGQDERMYWWRDHHINTAAQRLLAEALAQRLAE